MVNTRCLCPVAASTNQVGALSLCDGSLLIGKSHMQSGWEALAVSLLNASPADSLIVNQQHDKQQAGSEPRLPDINTTQSGKQSYMAHSI